MARRRSNEWQENNDSWWSTIMTEEAIAWSSLVEGAEGLYLPNCETNFVIALYTLSLLFFKFINTTAYHLGIYKPSSPLSCLFPGNSLPTGPGACPINTLECKFYASSES